MPIYTYRCEEGHEQDEVRLVDDRKKDTECRVCKGVASHVFSIFRPKKDNSNVVEESGMKVRYLHGKPEHVYYYRDVLCRSCGGKSYVDCSRDNEYDPSVASCDDCESSDVEVLISVPSIDRFSERFPYFDRGLGMWLTSKAHRKEMCRKLGVEPVDGDIDMTEEARKAERKKEADKKVYDDLQNKIDNHPGYAEYRRLKDRGWSPEFKHRRQK